mmetsp:Transcript_24026/g.23667  ORF Transcript_24026/g.23667 Transcript_24026/m.23667 type:complete len:126 (+) Transcript_24026:1023-1400(+)|eukprot:CAMPEP_0170552352 /NCGR_PEP_ID=MMETSP0211-20121228/10243_1 /TAXON_ID=311385 /ORGANISM="Pseudokeronopsis sp., Strain OXSARD2" /LENGTH=125 /DNA_ID=CAMNT_0010860025 /DNA_START=943 /DNA_END=1320 /DNA_ORIENTATION=-
MIIEKEIHLNKKELGISSDCQDLIERMLKKDAAQRIQMRDIFMHPWVEKYREWKYEKGSFLQWKPKEEEDIDMEQDTSHTNNQNVFVFNGEEMKHYYNEQKSKMSSSMDEEDVLSEAGIRKQSDL